MTASFELTGWYAWLAYAAAAYLLWTSVFEKGHAHLRWLRSRLTAPQVPAMPGGDPSPPTPLVRIGNPGGTQSSIPLTELREAEHTYLVRVEPSYGIWNDDPQRPIRDVITGARTREGREHVFRGYFAKYIAPGANELVHDVGSLPADWIRDIPQHAAFTHFLYWVHFTQDNVRWEIVHDPENNADWFTQIESPQPALDIRLENRGDHNRVLCLTNAGNVDLHDVECVTPPQAPNWQLLTDALPTYPVETLSPGDTVRIPTVVSLGGPAAVEILCRSWSETGPYERRTTVSVHD